jgi:uncharacterized protein (TIGR00369 family)
VKTLQPNSRFCFVCGLENSFGLNLRFYQTGPGEVTVNCVIREQYQSYPGIVHGGVVAAILDEVAYRSHMEDDPSRFMYTARLDLRYRKPVPVGKPLRIVGRAGVTKRRIATASGAIYDQEGTLLAEAEALLVNVPDETYRDIDLEELGWKVYPDDGKGDSG